MDGSWISFCREVDVDIRMRAPEGARGGGEGKLEEKAKRSEREGEEPEGGGIRFQV